MVKKISLMVSSQLFNFWFLLCCLVLTSCGKPQSKSNNTDYDKKVSSLDGNLKKVMFLADSTVNNILILHNAESSKRFYSEISSEKVINFLRESSVLGFRNKEANEYLLLYQYEGGVKDAFSCFEIADIGGIGERELTTTNYRNFKTESGLMLGISKDELIRIKGDSYNKEGNKIIYQITNYSSSNFLKNYNMPAYFLECTLKDNKITKIKYGFDYP